MPPSYAVHFFYSASSKMRERFRRPTLEWNVTFLLRALQNADTKMPIIAWPDFRHAQHAFDRSLWGAGYDPRKAFVHRIAAIVRHVRVKNTKIHIECLSLLFMQWLEQTRASIWTTRLSWCTEPIQNGNSSILHLDKTLWIEHHGRCGPLPDQTIFSEQIFGWKG